MIDAALLQSVSVDVENVLYVTEILQISICVDASKIHTIIDMSSQINVMSLLLIEKLELIM